jgi:hypothetical protein
MARMVRQGPPAAPETDAIEAGRPALPIGELAIGRNEI